MLEIMTGPANLQIIDSLSLRVVEAGGDEAIELALVVRPKQKFEDEVCLGFGITLTCKNCKHFQIKEIHVLRFIFLFAK